jgi:hypothetical protein
MPAVGAAVVAFLISIERIANGRRQDNLCSTAHVRKTGDIFKMASSNRERKDALDVASCAVETDGEIVSLLS